MQKTNPALNIGLNVVLFAVLIVLPFFIGNMFGNSWVNLLNFALIYVMLALGLNMVVGFAGLLDLGYVAFYAVVLTRLPCCLHRIWVLCWATKVYTCLGTSPFLQVL